MIKIDKLNPFGRMCISLGMLPSSYKESLTYEEQLLWFCNYLTETVIPTVNNNAEAVEELQVLYTQLKTYVDEYFDNLDVQEEINNKLDEMASDGTLDEIINQEIFGDIQTQINNLSSEVDTIKRNALYIGNSYATGYGSTSGSNGIFNQTKDLFNKAYLKSSGGIGFLQYTDHQDTFQTMLDNAINDTNINNNEITDIIIVSAWGDTRSLHESANIGTYRGNLQTAIINFMNSVKNNFPNIKRVACMLGESRGLKHIDNSSVYKDAFWIHQNFKELMPKNEMEYLGWIGFNIWLKTSYFSSDNYHPNDAGYKYLSTLFKTAYSGTLEYTPLKRDWSSRPCNITSGSSIKGYIVLTPDNAEFNIQELTLASGNTPAHAVETLLFDFGNNLPFSLPVPNGQESAFRLESGFICTTQAPNDVNYNASTNYMARIVLQDSQVENDIDSSSIKLITYGNSKQVSSSLNSICLPCKISWNLSQL